MKQTDGQAKELRETTNGENKMKLEVRLSNCDAVTRDQTRNERKELELRPRHIRDFILFVGV